MYRGRFMDQHRSQTGLLVLVEPTRKGGQDLMRDAHAVTT